MDFQDTLVARLDLNEADLVRMSILEPEYKSRPTNQFNLLVGTELADSFPSNNRLTIATAVS